MKSGGSSEAPDRQDSGDDPSAPRTIGEAGADTGRLRVLVADDEPTLRTVIGQVLAGDGHDVTAVASAEDALALFRENPFPLVITDVVMGGMSGLELLHAIKETSPDTLVVIMTSQVSLETATAALRGGAYDFLVKPFEDLILISAVVNRAADRLQLQARNRLLLDQLRTYAGELERLNKSLKEMADRDGTTGLFNHRYLRNALDAELARAARDGRVFSLVLLDVDHFKSYNDVNGHLAGDEALERLGAILVESGRPEYVCARYGGEEFAVLMPETEEAAAVEYAELIRRRTEEHPFPGREKQPHGRLTISLGVSSFPADGRDSRALIGRADEALYESKQMGRNTVRA